VTSTAPPLAWSAPIDAATAERQWSWPHYLCLIGAPILALQTWTLTAWLLDGPHQITEFRDGHTHTWWAARCYETLGVLLMVAMATYTVRQCRREGRLTFDAMYLICGMTMFWSDLGVNLFGPAYLMSSNFVNLNNPLGHTPGMTNPDIGRAPDPILFTICLESAGILAGMMLLCVIARRIKARNPNLSTAQLLLRLLGIGLLLDLAIEGPIIALGLWTYPAPSWMSVGFGNGLKFPAAEMLSGAMVFLFLGLVRFFKDDKGRTIVERGIDHIPPRRRAAMSLLALYAVTQIVAWGPSTWIDIAYVPFEQQWPKTPAHLVNDACDAPGITGTRFGPCPGSPGYRIPTRTTGLEGPNP
jgi:hypothetical protein